MNLLEELNIIVVGYVKLKKKKICFLCISIRGSKEGVGERSGLEVGDGILF